MLWEILRSKLNKNQKLTDDMLCLHNFIVFRELETEFRSINSRTFEFEAEVLELMSANPNEIIGIFGDEVTEYNQRRGGSEHVESRIVNNKRKYFRSAIKGKTQSMRLHRPRKNWFRSQTIRIH